MIIKGRSRAKPILLAEELLHAGHDTAVEILELKSGHDDLTETLRDWQVISEGTQGSKGLYHANIDPAKGDKMTPEKWIRAANVLEEELGLQEHPRAIVLHRKQGHEHAHVVWQRTDIDTMTLVSDSKNYPAHERACQRLKYEFSQETDTTLP